MDMRYCRYILLALFFTGFAVSLAGGSKITNEGNLIIEGGDEAVIDTVFSKEAFAADFEITPMSYPLSSEKNPAFELIVNPPVTTEKIRFVSNDRGAHITEIRLFEPGMPRYPDILAEGGEGLDVPNFALDAKVTASSRYSDTRDEGGAVDGSLAFDSRWTSRGKAPHRLTIDMGKKRTIGCIQMVSGYLSGTDWESTARDFHFEYFSEDEWKTVPNSGRKADAETASLAITLSGKDKKYYFINRRKEKNWAAGVQNSGDKINIVEEFSLPQANIYEGQTHLLKAVFTGNSASVILDGKSVLNVECLLEGELKAGIESLSSNAVIELKDASVERFDLESSDLLSRVDLRIPDSDRRVIAFNPLKNSYQYPLASKEIKRLRVEAVKADPGQNVTINGKASRSSLFDISNDAKRDIEITVQSPDGLNSRRYMVEVLPVPPAAEYELAFNDEFEYAQLDMDKWHYRRGKRWTSIQRPENIEIDDGKLLVNLEADEDNQYTGGVITNEKFGYGYYETSAKLWKGKGWHSAFWQMQVDGVRVNEIDCFESTSPETFSCNLHYYNPRHIIGGKSFEADVAGGFNVFAWEWLPDRVRFYFNGELIRDEPYPGPHLPQNVWLSCVAHPDASTDDLPGTVEFEYFRYYKKDYMVSPEKSEIVSTNSDGYSELGVWRDGEYAISCRGDFGTRLSTTAGSAAVWQTDINQSGLYEVYVWNAYIFPDKNVFHRKYSIHSEAGTVKASINPASDGQRWVKLGEFEFNALESVSVSLNVKDGGVHRAGSVAFIKK